ncbi:MAG: DUF4358 domain-containing protein [Oscillospiraceae bacterium]|jgi:ABC-type Fe3+-hydroxamate transport system substrate-binding protein|nr:DUF4358 domain-containing protein [Oscillospiraceae bacterium]
MKKACFMLLALLLTVAMVACGGAKANNGNKAKDVDVAKLAAELAEKVKFDAELKELSSDMLGNYVNLPEGAQAAGYMSAGATSEEIFAIRCADDGSAKAVKADIEAFLSAQRAEMERYQPEEAARMDNAVLKQQGTVVVLCVTSDTDTAEKIVKEYLG